MHFKRKKTNQIEDYLRYIKKNGDLYDAISKKRNATPDTPTRKTIKLHTIIFSRILYLGLVLTNRIKNNFTPVEKVKRITDELRDFIDVQVDIIRSKTNNKSLGIVYSDYSLSSDDPHPGLEDLIIDLKKISTFAQKYNIDDIYIEKYFLNRFLSDEFLSSSNFYNMGEQELLHHELYSYPSYILIKTSPKRIGDIITKLEHSKYDNEFIYSLKNKIKNKEIIKGIDDFYRTNDGEKLLKIAKQELFKIINEEGPIKDRTLGKIHESYEIAEEFVRKTIIDSEGNYVAQNIITLYSFLEVINYSHLEDVANTPSEDQELKLISLLYLNLLGEKAKEQRNKIQIKSLYDFIYEKHKNTSLYKKIPWINSFFQKRKAEKVAYASSIFSVILTYILLALGVHIPNHWLNIDGPKLDAFNKFVNGIKNAYEASYEYEQNLINSIKQSIEQMLPNNPGKDISKEAQSTAKKSNKDNKSNKIAEIEWFSKEQMPIYFVDQYAKSGHLYSGEYEFWLTDPTVNMWNISETRPLFQIKSPISKSDLEDQLDRPYFHIPLNAYPVGDTFDYVLTEVYIKDEKDPTKYLKVDEEWVHTYGGELNSEDKELLMTIEEPMVYYIYGASNNHDSQISSSYYNNYTDTPSSQITDAIKEGLGLESTATNEEINQEISEKSYTKYPKYTPKKSITEVEYAKTIASLDPIDTDLLSILTTLANESSTYVSGFKNTNGDNEITLDEAYIWVLDENGEVIDFLKQFSEENNYELSITDTNNMDYEKEKEENSFVSFNEDNNKKTNTKTTSNEEVVDETKEEDIDKESKAKETLNIIKNWAKEHHVSYYVFAILAIIILNKLFGKKIKFKIQLVKSNNILSAKNIDITYNDLLEFVYGEESSPIKRSKNKLIEAIWKEFYAFNEEDIEELLNKLKETKNTNKELEALLKMIPFIKENACELVEYQPKKLVLGGRHEK